MLTNHAKQPRQAQVVKPRPYSFFLRFALSFDMSKGVYHL